MAKKLSFEFGDWVVDEHGLIYEVTDASVSHLHISGVRKLKGVDIPVFKYDEKYCINHGMDKKHFWDAAEKHCPLAVTQFKAFIDSYKNSVKWWFYIKDGVKFHDLPFHLQVGVLIKFFVHHDLPFHPDRDDFMAENLLGIISRRIVKYEVQLRNNRIVN